MTVKAGGFLCGGDTTIPDGWSANLSLRDYGRIARDSGIIRSRRFVAYARDPLLMLV
jgi:hypothetical protein